MPKLRKIIEIDEELCDGCGQCVLACAEGALQIIDGKARLVGEIYCDGLGACLGECPQGALRIVEREAEEFDEKAVEELLARRRQEQAASPPAEVPLACGCPGSAAMALSPAGATQSDTQVASTLGHWPIKLQLLAPQAPFLRGADLILLADCTGVAYPDLHPRLLPGKAVALACPKLDDPQAHIAKLAQVLEGARPRSLTVVRMEVPCCGGLEWIAQEALKRAGLEMTVGSMIVSRDGKVLETRDLPWESAA
jgi:NAD-dependent dihydropyrimidine dehydrogenase PreA subunit